MKAVCSQWVLKIWYGTSWLATAFSPLALIFRGIVTLRRYLYRAGLFKSHRLSVPVIIIGNITVGGTGKTPLLVAIANFLLEQGFRPGIISRGYGGISKTWPLWVDENTPVEQIGDEAALLARRVKCPLVVGPKRIDAARLLLRQSACDVILSDDGLQHYALQRDIEIAVIDGERRYGNGWCLPTGPLREPVDRLSSVDFVVVNGEKLNVHEFAMQIKGEFAVNLRTGERKGLQQFAGSKCMALAGIGNPKRFFDLLAAADIFCEQYPFPDHYVFGEKDIHFLGDAPILMTEKDAVKCFDIATNRHWYIPIEAELEFGFAEKLLALLNSKMVR